VFLSRGAGSHSRIDAMALSRGCASSNGVFFPTGKEPLVFVIARNAASVYRSAVFYFLSPSL
jgi:hypothetical protein